MTEAELVRIEQALGVGSWSAVALTAAEVPALVAEVRRLQAREGPLLRAMALIRVNPALAVDVVTALELDA